MAAVGCIVVYSYYPGYAESALSISNALITRFGDIPVVVVTSKSTHAWWSEREYNAFHIIAHDNSNWEFGAYLKGVDYAQNVLKVGGGIIILNDTVGIHSILDQKMIAGFSKLVEDVGAHEKVLIGEVDSWEHPIKLDGRDATNWVRSCFIYIGCPAISVLLGMDISEERVDRLAELKLAPVRYVDGNKSDGIARHLNSWLIEGGVQGAYKTGEQVNLDQNKQMILRNKGRSIIREKLLSSEIVDQGGRLMDMVDRSFPGFLLFRLKRRLQKYSPSIIKKRANRNEQ